MVREKYAVVRPREALRSSIIPLRKRWYWAVNYAPKVLPSEALVLMPNNATCKIKGFDAARLAADGGATPAGRAGHGSGDCRYPGTEGHGRVCRLACPGPYLVEEGGLFRTPFRRRWYLSSLPLTAESLTNIVHGIGTDAANSVGINSTWTGIWGGLARFAGGITAFLGSIFALIGSFIPGYAKPWANISLKWPITCGVVGAIVLALYWLNGALRDRIADLRAKPGFR